MLQYLQKQRKTVTIGILGAMREEITPLLAKLSNIEEINYAGNTYYKAELSNHNLVIAYSKIGKVNSAITASVLCEHFKIQKLIFSGVAGGIDEDLNIGDLVYATKLLQHDLDLSAFGHPYGFVPESKVFFETDSKLCEIAIKVAKNNNIDLKPAIIASGDQFIASNERKDWIKDTFKANAIEMEGASVANVCSHFDLPLFVLRAISDSANDSADMDFDKFLETSAKVSAEFVINMIKEI